MFIQSDMETLVLETVGDLAGEVNIGKWSTCRKSARRC